MKLGQLFKSRLPSTEDSGTAVFLTAFSKLEHHSRARSLTAVERNVAPWVICRSSQIGSATMLRVRFHVQAICTLAPLNQAVWSPPLFTACVCDLCRVHVLVRLSHPRPPDRNQHGCTVGVLPGPTRVLPMPRQYGIGRRAPTRAVLSCAALWCLVVRHPRRRVDCLVLTFCYVSSRTFVREFLYQEVLYLHTPSVTVDCCQLSPIYSG